MYIFMNKREKHRKNVFSKEIFFSFFPSNPPLCTPLHIFNDEYEAQFKLRIFHQPETLIYIAHNEHRNQQALMT